MAVVGVAVVGVAVVGVAVVGVAVVGVAVVWVAGMRSSVDTSWLTAKVESSVCLPSEKMLY